MDVSVRTNIFITNKDKVLSQSYFFKWIATVGEGIILHLPKMMHMCTIFIYSLFSMYICVFAYAKHLDIFGHQWDPQQVWRQAVFSLDYSILDATSMTHNISSIRIQFLLIDIFGHLMAVLINVYTFWIWRTDTVQRRDD